MLGALAWHSGFPAHGGRSADRPGWRLPAAAPGWRRRKADEQHAPLLPHGSGRAGGGMWHATARRQQCT